MRKFIFYFLFIFVKISADVHLSKEAFILDKVKKAFALLISNSLKNDITSQYKSQDLNDIVYHFLHAVNNKTLSNECSNDLNQIYSAVMDSDANQDFLDNAVFPMFDAFGKIPPGILAGAVSFWGYAPECNRISYKLKNGHTFKGSYSRIYFDVNSTYTKCDFGTTELIGFDVCTPKTCANDNDLMELGKLTDLIDYNISVCYADILDDQPAKVTYKTWIVGSIMGIIVIVALIVTIADYLCFEMLGIQQFHQNFYLLAISFSLYRNIKELFTVSSNKSGQITTIHCIRFFSTCWVVVGHTAVFSAVVYNNVLDFAVIIKDLPIQIIANSQISIDCFFLISGVLVAFLWFKQFKKNEKATMSKKSWIYFYVHRYLRLSPSYYLTVVFYAFVYFTLINNKPALIDITSHKTCVHIDNDNTTCVDPCSQTWWTNFLYLNNFIDHNSQCYGITWYLATEFQMYAFSPLILIPLAIKPWLGWVVATFIMIASTTANIVTVYANRYPPIEYNGIGWIDPNEKHPDQYDMLIYQAPWIRCQVYIIGIMTGYCLQMRTKMRINKFLNITLWLISISLMATVVFSLKDWMNNHEISLFGRAMYSAFSKPAYCLGLSWIIISCYYGYGGPINDFMSWKIWVPLSRVSYCVYLIHIMIIIFIIGLTQSPLVFSGFPHLFATLIIPVIFFSFLISILWSALFEIPFSKLETLLLKGDEQDKQFLPINKNDTRRT